MTLSGSMFQLAERRQNFWHLSLSLFLSLSLTVSRFFLSSLSFLSSISFLKNTPSPHVLCLFVLFPYVSFFLTNLTFFCRLCSVFLSVRLSFCLSLSFAFPFLALTTAKNVVIKTNLIVKMIDFYSLVKLKFSHLSFAHLHSK